MNSVHWHLLLTHAPLFGAIGAFGLLTFGVIRKAKPIERAGLVVMILSALIAIPTYSTGEGAEHAIEDLAWFSHDATERHEDVADIAYKVILAAGVIALIAWFGSRFGKVGIAIRWIAVVMSLASVLTMSVTAWYGGKVGHPEIRNDSFQDLFRNSPGTPAPEQNDHDYEEE